MEIVPILKQYGACGDAVAWAKGKSVRAAWEECPRGDWLLWIAAKVGVDRRTVTLAAVGCAKLALKHWTKDDSLKTNLAVVERWANGKATDAELAAARDNLWKIRYAHAAAAAAYAYADAAAAYDAAADARSETLKRCAAIVLKRIPFFTIMAAYKRQS